MRGVFLTQERPPFRGRAANAGMEQRTGVSRRCRLRWCHQQNRHPPPKAMPKSGGFVGWLAGRLVGWLIGWLAGWLVGWNFDEEASIGGRTIRPTVGVHVTLARIPAAR